MKHIKLFEEHVQDDKGYLGDNVGIMFNPEKKLMYIGSSKDSTKNYTIKDVSSEDEAFQLKELLKNANPEQWEFMLKRAGYDVTDGKDYFVK